ncbi:MAG: exodeoxyribonuclease VII small subunit [Tissierellia bacterium]|nr:exodeoxyribonuclease VII small subunit [Tissierellia bacterium]
MDISKLSYEEAIEELEEIISFLEQDDYSLKEAMDKFKRGVELYKHCHQLLCKAEGEIKILLGDEEKDFEELDLLREVDGEY